MKQIITTDYEVGKIKDLKFILPTNISKQEPIFTLCFNLQDEPVLTIFLNRNYKNITKTNKSTHKFNTMGSCIINSKYSNDYFIDGEVILVPEIRQSNSDNYCKVNINYGKGSSQLFYIKGIFNLNDFNI